MYQLSTQSSMSARVTGILNAPSSNSAFWKNLSVSLVILLTALLPSLTKAQTTVNMTNGSSYSCSSNFYDSQGPTLSYNNSENFTYTFYPATAGAKVKVVFTSLATESGWDYLYIYNGNSTAAPLLGSYTGTIAAPPTFTSTAADGSLTFKFTSDASVTAAGWVAQITCLITAPCSGTMTGGAATASTTTACPGVPVTLGVTGSSGGTGITYQWYSSPTGLAGSWTPITGATTMPYIVTPPTGTTTYYKTDVTCTASGSTATSTSVAVSVSSMLTVPYTETFEGTTPGVNVPCATALPSFSTSTYYYGTDYWKIINDATATYGASNHTPGGANYLVAGYYIGTYVGTPNYWFTPGINLSAGKTYRFSYWHRMSDYAASSYAGTFNHGMYYATAPTAAASKIPIKGDILATSNNSYIQNVGDFSVPTSGIYYLGIYANNTNFGGYYCAGSFDDLNLIELPDCSTATATTFGAGGKAKASPNVMCSVPSATTLSLSATPPFSGLSFSWDTAYATPSGFATPTVPVLAATGSYTISAGGTYFLRCKVTCAATGLTAYSDTVQVTTTPITPPYIETFESGTPGTNMPCAGSTYWGSIPSYFNIGTGPYTTSAPGVVNHTPGGTKFLYCGYLLGAYYLGAAQYWFTPALALTAAKAYEVSYWYSNSGYYPSSYASYATDMGIYAGTSQTAAAMTITTGPDTTIYINAVGTPTYGQYIRGFIAPSTGSYYVGIKVNHKTYCYYGFAIDDIGVSQMPPCSAKPTAGKAMAKPNLICTTGSTTISLVGTSLASDLTFAWDSSTVSATGPWSPVIGGTGATTPGYTTPILTAGPVYYRCRVTCPLIGGVNYDTSTATVVNIGAIAMPYVEDFELGTAGVNMPCASYASTWSSPSYWTLMDGAYSTSYPGLRNHTPGGTKYISSGYYNGPYYGSGDQYYWFTPGLKMNAGKAYKVSFWFNGTGYSTGTNSLKLGIYAGTAQNAAGMTIRAGGLDSAIDATSNTYAQMTRSFVAPTTGTYYVGLKTVHSGYNLYGIPLDDIGIDQMPDCSGKPTAGVPDASPIRICTSGTTRLRLSGTSIASGITYQWQEAAAAAGPFVNSTLGTGPTTGDYLTATLTSGKYYRCIVTCSISGLKDTSSVLYVPVGAMVPPYRETFETVIPGTNAVCASNSGTWGTASSTNYWTTKGFPYAGYGMKYNNHTPGGTNYLWGGYYFGYSPAAGAMWFTPAMSLTKDTTYEFSFWYQGPAYYYYNSGVELGMFYGTAQTEAAMTNTIKSLYVDKRDSYKQMIGRFKAVATGNYYMGIRVRHTYSTYSYYGTAIDDIALDQLSPCTGAPTIGEIYSKPHMLCAAGTVKLDMEDATLTKASGLTYRWEWTNTDPSSGTFIPVGTSATLTAPTYTTPTISTTTWYRCIAKCAYTGDSTISSNLKIDVNIVIPPYFQTFEYVDQGVNAPCATNTNTFSPSSWSYWGTYRVPISTSYPAIVNHTAGGTAYLMAGYYLGTYYSGAVQYWFTPRIQLTGGKLYQFSYWYSGSGYSGGKTDLGAAYGTTNSTAGMTTIIGTPLSGVNTYSYKQFVGKFTPAASGAYYLGIKVSHTTYAYPGIAIDDIGLQEVPPCSSTVTAGTIFADPVRVCNAGGTTTLDLAGSTLATGLIYNWMSAPSAAGPYTLTTGTSTPYLTDPLMADTWFRAIVTCTTSGKSDTSAPFKVNVGGYDLPYSEDFESTVPNTKPLCSDATFWSTYGYYYDAWNVYAGTYTGAYGNHTPGGNKHLIGGYYLGYAAYTTGYPSATDDNYWWTPGLKLRGGYKYNLNFWYVAASSSYPAGNKVGVKYGTAQSVGAMTKTIMPFTVKTNTSYANFDTNFTVASNGTYYLGFQKSSSTLGTLMAYGVAFDDINLNYAPCSGTPFAGAIISSVTSGTPVCKYTPMTLADTGATLPAVPGIKYQWQRRGLSIPPTVWTNIAGATDTLLKSDTLVGYEYRLAVICGNTNDSAFSAAFQLPAIAPHPPVTINPNTTPITFCLGDSVKFNATSYAGANYDWMLDSVVIPGWKFSDFSATKPGTYMVKVSSALSPCPTWSNKIILVTNAPGYTVSITTPADSFICAGTSMYLTASSSKSGVSYQWRKNNVIIPGATSSAYLVTTGGAYSVTAWDGVSVCPAMSRTINITVKANPPAIITVPGGTTTACENEGVLLTANTGGYKYEWLRGGSTIVGWTDSSVLVKNSGTYTVKVRNADGCVSVSASKTVVILPAPTPVITKTGSCTSIVLGTTLTSYVSWQWSRNGVDIPGATGPTYGPLTKSGLYRVRVTSANNCVGESTPIEIIDQCLSIANATVNADDVKIYPNPTQSKVFIESPQSVQVKVKDLAGKTIFEGQVVKEVDLSKFADGVYLFIISDKDGEELIKQQRVTKVSNK